jgi:uncharacterized membrane protein
MFQKEQLRKLRDIMKRRWAERRSHHSAIKQGVTPDAHAQSEAAKNADDFNVENRENLELLLS